MDLLGAGNSSFFCIRRKGL